MKIQVKRLRPEAKGLVKGSVEAAGYDLHYSGPWYPLMPWERHVFGTGIAVEFPTGNVALIWDRSGMGAKGIHRFGGVIDSDYRGEWKVILWNSGEERIIRDGDAIAQVLFQPVHNSVIIEEVIELGDTARGASGCGVVEIGNLGLGQVFDLDDEKWIIIHKDTVLRQVFVESCSSGNKRAILWTQLVGAENHFIGTKK